MGGATPHGGVEPSVGPKTVVVGFPRVVFITVYRLNGIHESTRLVKAPFVNHLVLSHLLIILIVY